MKLTITEALVKLKLLDKKINDKVNSLVPAVVVHGKNQPTGFPNDDSFVQWVDANYQSAEDLISYRDKIKQAIVRSNAVTKVKIGNLPEMTVAEAIEKKSSIKYSESLFNRLNNLYTQALNVESQTKAQLDKSADEFVQKTFGQKENNNNNVMEARKLWLEQNKIRLVTSQKVVNKIKELKDHIEDFKANVDTALSVVNATTLIEVSE